MEAFQIANHLYGSAPYAMTALPLVTLMVLLIGATVIDLQRLHIPNWLTVSGALLGVVWQWLLPDGHISDALWGWAGGLLVLLPLYWLRAMGAGDIKMMAMVGAFLGLGGVVIAALCTALVGGLLSLFVAFFRGNLGRLIRNVHAMTLGTWLNATAGIHVIPTPVQSVGRMPYGGAITAGTMLCLLLRDLGVWA